jgi:glycosyltransferase involved in cell wall biosynthesis
MMTRSPRRVYFDVSDFLDYASRNSVVSGIQRVIFKTITHASSLNPDLQVLLFDKKFNSFLATDSTPFHNMPEFDQEKICRYYRFSSNPMDVHFGELDEYLNSRYDDVKWSYHKKRLPLINRLSRGHSYQKRRIVPPSSREPCRPWAIWRQTKFEPGDRILVLGSTWNIDGHGPALARAKAAGVEVVQMIYDLIPILTPEFVGPDFPTQFEAYIRNMLATVDIILAISAATARDLHAYAEDKGLPAPNIVVTPLAHEFVTPPAPESRHFGTVNRRRMRLTEHATPRVCWATAEPYVLVVGTIEARKNILRIVQHWRRLLDKHGPRIPHLILAGKPGFHSHEVMHALNHSGDVFGKVKFVEKPDDGELAYLYANCRFSLCLSHIEGWGLPIGESLWFGRPVLASSVSSMPEVGGDLVDYAAPDDDAEIEAALERLMFDDAHLAARVAAIESAKLRTWSDVAGHIWNVARDA